MFSFANAAYVGLVDTRLQPKLTVKEEHGPDKLLYFVIQKVDMSKHSLHVQNNFLTFGSVQLFNEYPQENDLLFIHSFIRPFLQRPFKSSTTQRCSRLQHGYCIGVSRRSAKATVGKGLAQGPYMAARAGIEPTTLRLKAIDSTKAPPCPT